VNAAVAITATAVGSSDNFEHRDDFLQTVSVCVFTLAALWNLDFRYRIRVFEGVFILGAFEYGGQEPLDVFQRRAREFRLVGDTHKKFPTGGSCEIAEAYITEPVLQVLFENVFVPKNRAGGQNILLLHMRKVFVCNKIRSGLRRGGCCPLTVGSFQIWFRKMLDATH
jgi:hypothetical protein